MNTSKTSSSSQEDDPVDHHPHLTYQEVRVRMDALVEEKLAATSAEEAAAISKKYLSLCESAIAKIGTSV